MELTAHVDKQLQFIMMINALINARFLGVGQVGGTRTSRGIF